MKHPYRTFAAMILTSMVVMYGAMYLNTYEVGHALFSETRAYMTGLMGAIMAAVMLSFMTHMYKDKRANAAIYAGSAVLFAASLWLVRSQSTVGDISWMKAMIPHHSMAILTSERANIDDLRVRALADDIIKAQRREISEMQWLIDDIRANGKAGAPGEAEARAVDGRAR